MQTSEWTTKRLITIGLVAIIVGKIFGPVGLAVMALIILWREGTKERSK